MILGAVILIHGIARLFALIVQPCRKDGGANCRQRGCFSIGGAKHGGLVGAVLFQCGVGWRRRIGDGELHFLDETAADDGILLVESLAAGFANEDFLADVVVDEMLEF